MQPDDDKQSPVNEQLQTPTRCYVEFLQAMLGNYIRDTSALDNVLAPHPDGHVGVFSSPTEKVI